MSVKVLHVAKRYFPDRGGIETVTRDLAAGMDVSDVAVLCFATEASVGVANPEPFEVVRCPVDRTLGSQDVSVSYLIELRRMAREVDVLHLHAPNFLAMFGILIAAKRPLLVHWHADVVGKGWLYEVLKPLERLVLKRATAIICTSNSYAESSEPLRAFRDKIRILPIGINDGPPPPDPSQRSGSTILAVGRLEPYKNYHLLIESMKSLPESVTLDIVGTGSLQQSLQDQIDEAGLGDRVRLRGKLSDEELDALFRQARIHVLASSTKAEAFGVVLLEAMRNGLPSVCFRVHGSGMNEVNQHDVTGLVVQDVSAPALAEALMTLIEDDVMYARLSKGARAVFEDRYQVDQVQSAYRALLEGLDTGAR